MREKLEKLVPEASGKSAALLQILHLLTCLYKQFYTHLIQRLLPCRNTLVNMECSCS